MDNTIKLFWDTAVKLQENGLGVGIEKLKIFCPLLGAGGVVEPKGDYEIYV